ISEPERREAPTVEEETAPKPAEAQERVPGQPVRAARRVDPEERDRHLAEFLRRMRDQLPRQVDDSTSLVRVDNEGDVVTLGFSLTSVVPKELASNIADILRNRFNSNVCDSSTPSEIRTLSEDGV